MIRKSCTLVYSDVICVLGQYILVFSITRRLVVRLRMFFCLAHLSIPLPWLTFYCVPRSRAHILPSSIHLSWEHVRVNRYQILSGEAKRKTASHIMIYSDRNSSNYDSVRIMSCRTIDGVIV